MPPPAAIRWKTRCLFTLRCIAAATNNGTFRLEDPDGIVLGDIVMSGGAATVSEQIKGALADGATDFAVGDGFDITVSAITFKDVEFNPPAPTVPRSRLASFYRPTDASSADQRAVSIRRSAEVNDNLVTWKTGTTTAQKAKGKQDLAKAAIIFRA